ncbi:MAG: hypothetical protein M0Z95_18165 [Actinomycetota bacterium]|nr:hypothetical protein [Actinomycetota bacterium]
MTRSPISRVAPNSMDSGNATAVSPWKKMAEATSPGSATVARL